MSNVDAVLQCQREHPLWGASRIAPALGLNYNTVKGILWRHRHELATIQERPARAGQITQVRAPAPAASFQASKEAPTIGSGDLGGRGSAPLGRSGAPSPTPRPRKHIVIPDTQCKPGVPLEHLLWAGRYIAEQKPDVVVHLGDHWDFPSLSSYEKRGSHYFENRRLCDDIDAGNEGMELFAQGIGSFKPARRVLLRGNHEDRLTRAINESPVLIGTVGFDMLDDGDWEVMDYLRPVEIDGLYYAHYFYNPNTGRSYSGSVDTMLRNIGASFVMGHQQGLRVGRRELANGKTQRGLVAGSFYQHEESYRGPQAAYEWRGILVLHEVEDGDYDLMEVSLDYLRRRYG